MKSASERSAPDAARAFSSSECIPVSRSRFHANEGTITCAICTVFPMRVKSLVSREGCVNRHAREVHAPFEQRDAEFFRVFSCDGGKEPDCLFVLMRGRRHP